MVVPRLKRSRCPWIGLLGILCWGLASRGAAQTLNLPARAPNALTGSQLTNILAAMPLTERENWIFAQVLSGNVPGFLRTLVPITATAMIGGSNHSGTYYVTSDYLAIGSDADYFLAPATPLLGQRLCDALGCTLPSRKVVNQIWTNAAVKLNPQPIPPSAAMITVPVFAEHNLMVRTQRMALTNSFPLGALVAGDKKDVIVSTKIYTNFSGPAKPVVIYGWQYPSGSPIQPLYNGHEETYADYSHGLRLVQNTMLVDGRPTTVSNVLADPELAPLLSDEGIAEGSTDGAIHLPRYTVAAAAPVVITHPGSHTVAPGGQVSFSVEPAGDLPFSFSWLRNGVAVAGETNASLALEDVQPTNAGSYSAVVLNHAGAVTSRVAVLRVSASQWPILFADNFEANTAVKWNLFWGAANGLPDYTADWAFEYRAVPYTFNGMTALIPPAPNSGEGTSRALRLAVNNHDQTAAAAGVNVYPRGQVFSNAFALKFDLWINYPGGPSGLNSTGSTEHAIFGLNHFGTEANWAAPSGSASDGAWFAVDGEGGTSRDYRAYVGNPFGPPAELIGASSGLAESNNAAPLFQALFPLARFESPGAPGKQWVEVELRQTNRTVLWIMDGTIIAQRTNSSPFQSGNIMLGLMDTFSSIANPAKDSFVLFDNLRVEDLDRRPRLLELSRGTDGTTTLTLSVIPGKLYVLERSTDLSAWEAAPPVLATNAPLVLVDATPGRASACFYRARQVVP